MASRLLVNDSWVLERAGYFSSSFSGFLSKITGGLKLSTKIQKEADIALRAAFPKGSEDLGIPGFIQPMISKIFGSIGAGLEPIMQETIKTAIEEAQQKKHKKLQMAQQSKRLALKDAIEIKEKAFSKLDDRLAKLDNELGKMDQTIGQRVATRLFSTNMDSLATALYTVAKERGVTNEGVLNLIQTLPEFDALLYIMNVRKFYRDHTAHSLRVAAIGDFLLGKSGSGGALEKLIQEKLHFTPAEVKTAWWFTGLLHDIGTPLAKLFTSLNWSLINELVRCYSNIGMEFFPLQIRVNKSELGNFAYLKVLSKGLPKAWQKLIIAGLGTIHEQPESFIYLPKTQKNSEYQPPTPHIDHGVIAALTLLGSLGSPARLEQEHPADRPLIEAARAIALHNFLEFLDPLQFEDYPLLFLLAITDELQEWGRPIPVSIDKGYFTTTLEKITLTDAIFHNSDAELWDIPYTNGHAKKLMHFDFKRLRSDKEKKLQVLDCSEQFPETELWLIDFDQEKSEAADKFEIRIHTHKA